MSFLSSRSFLKNAPTAAATGASPSAGATTPAGHEARRRWRRCPIGGRTERAAAVDPEGCQAEENGHRGQEWSGDSGQSVLTRSGKPSTGDDTLG